MISIQTNIAALYGQQNFQTNQDFEQNTIEQLTSGYRINSSADDAAGLAIANSLVSETTELTQDVSNANNGVSQLQIIDGGLTNITSILERLKTLATQAASSTFTGNFTTLNNEFQTNQALGVYVGGGIGNNNGQQIGTANENVNLGNVTAFYISAAATATQVTGTYAQSSYSQFGYTASSATQAVVFSQGTSGYSIYGGTTVNLGYTNTSTLVATLNLAGLSSVAAVTGTQLGSVDAYSLGLALGTAATAPRT
jgi:Bacterial flagellin N-terminal helical region